MASPTIMDTNKTKQKETHKNHPHEREWQPEKAFCGYFYKIDRHSIHIYNSDNIKMRTDYIY